MFAAKYRKTGWFVGVDNVEIRYALLLIHFFKIRRDLSVPKII